jgi:protein-S-isoprenylcysteine O-methyltransferase Ste14
MTLCSFGFLDLHNLKLIGIWSLTRHPHYLTYFPAALAGVIGSPSYATSMIMNRPSNVLVGPHLPLLGFFDVEGYK